MGFTIFFCRSAHFVTCTCSASFANIQVTSTFMQCPECAWEIALQVTSARKACACQHQATVYSSARYCFLVPAGAGGRQATQRSFVQVIVSCCFCCSGSAPSGSWCWDLACSVCSSSTDGASRHAASATAAAASTVLDIHLCPTMLSSGSRVKVSLCWCPAGPPIETSLQAVGASQQCRPSQ